MIVLEGLDAAGKATQAKRLVDRLQHLGHEAVLYSFPRYETPAGRLLKRHLTNEVWLTNETQYTNSGIRVRDSGDALWFQALNLADKCEVAWDIRKRLSAGHFVVCDRWTPSALAFGGADGLDRTWLEDVHAVLPAADLYVYLRISEEEALRRRPVLRDRYEKDRAKQAAVRAEYERLWEDRGADATNPKLWVVVDGEGSAEEVAERIWSRVVAVS